MRLVLPVLMMLCLPALADPPKPAPVRLELTATVAEIPQPIRYCGVIAFRTVVRYAVVSVEKGTWTEKDVYAITLCPERIKVGQKLKMSLYRPAPTEGHVDKFPGTSPRWTIVDWKTL